MLACVQRKETSLSQGGGGRKLVAAAMSYPGDRSEMAAAASTSQWFHKNIGRMETEKLLVENREDGSFLIRKSDNVKGAYVLSTM